MKRTLLTFYLDSPFALRSVVGDGDDGDGGNNQGFAPGRQFSLAEYEKDFVNFRSR